jgi:hypothetical protein
MARTMCIICMYQDAVCPYVPPEGTGQRRRQQQQQQGTRRGRVEPTNGKRQRHCVGRAQGNVVGCSLQQQGRRRNRVRTSRCGRGMLVRHCSQFTAACLCGRSGYMHTLRLPTCAKLCGRSGYMHILRLPTYTKLCCTDATRLELRCRIAPHITTVRA